MTTNQKWSKYPRGKEVRQSHGLSYALLHWAALHLCNSAVHFSGIGRSQGHSQTTCGCLSVDSAPCCCGKVAWKLVHQEMLTGPRYLLEGSSLELTAGTLGGVRL